MLTIYFNPLSPHGERPELQIYFMCPKTFQSTLPAWGETTNDKCKRGVIFNFNPLSPHGERPALAPVPARAGKISIHSPRMGRDNDVNIAGSNSDISIHSPRMGRDIMQQIQCMRRRKFQSTLPAWGETAIPWSPLWQTNFNPLSPHGERPRQFSA